MVLDRSHHLGRFLRQYTHPNTVVCLYVCLCVPLLFAALLHDLRDLLMLSQASQTIHMECP